MKHTMFLIASDAEDPGLSCGRTPGRHRRATVAPPDKPLVLLVSSEDVARELRLIDNSAYYFGGSGADPVTGIDRELRDAVRFAAHPVDLVRRLGEWADHVQAAVPPGRVAACWHPAVTADVLRQASLYPVHVVHARTTGEARAAIEPLLAQASATARAEPGSPERNNVLPTSPN